MSHDDRAAPFDVEPPRRRTDSRLSWVIRRSATGALTLLVVSMLIFGATQALPGDVAVMMLGKDASPSQIASLRTELHLDQPVVVQYARWLGGVLEGQLGNSTAAHRPVSSIVAPRLDNSLTLVVVSMALSLPLAAAVGLLAAFHKDRWFDRLLLGVSLAINAVPEFVLGLLLVVLLSTTVLHLLPAVSLLSPERSVLSQWPALVLPVITLVLLQTTYLYRLVRASVIDVLATDYIQFAELKGVAPRRLLLRHALPNAALPAIQAAATVFAISMGGMVVIESVFGFPGIGTALTDAVGNRDIAVVQAIVLIIATTFVLANAAADLIGALLTPPGRGRAGAS